MGEILKGLFDKAPDIIGKAAESPLGLASLSVLVLGTLGFVLFRDAADKLKLLALAMITGGFLGFMTLAFGPARITKTPLPTLSDDQTGEPNNESAALSPPRQPDRLNRIEASMRQVEISQIQRALCVVQIDGQLGPPGSKTRSAIVDFFEGFGTPRPSVNSDGITPKDALVLREAIHAVGDCVTKGFRNANEVGKSLH